jgi:copper transport protein
VSKVVEKGPYKIHLTVNPNRAAVQNSFEATVTKNGKPVPGAEVVAHFIMLDMEMGTQSYQLRQTRPGTFSKAAPALVMVGHWALQFEVHIPGQAPFEVTLLDKAGG